MEVNENTAPIEDAQVIEDKTREELEKVAEEYADKDSAMAEDLKKLSKSRLSLESFNEYMRLRAEQVKFNAVPNNEKRHKEKCRIKRRKANKNAKQMRKLNRKR